MRSFAILETIHQEQAGFTVSISDRLRFRIIETYSTLNGPRSRMCDGGWKTKEEAIGVLFFMQETNLADLRKDVGQMELTMKNAREGQEPKGRVIKD